MLNIYDTLYSYQIVKDIKYGKNVDLRIIYELVRLILYRANQRPILMIQLTYIFYSDSI